MIVQVCMIALSKVCIKIPVLRALITTPHNKLDFSICGSCDFAINKTNHRSRTHSNAMQNCLPLFASGEIVPGFGRGSKELGIPTANYDLKVVKSLPTALQTGIYYGWANIDNGDVHKMVMSIGKNPYYDNKEKSMETHIIHNYNRDLYGQLLKVCIVGYLRPELNFKSLDELKAAIHSDIDQAVDLLNADDEVRKLRHSKFFKDPQKSCNAPVRNDDEFPARNGCRS